MPHKTGQTALRGLGLVCVWVAVSTCALFSSPASSVALREYALPKYGIALSVPEEWKTEQDRFYQLKSEGGLAKYSHLSFAYRGLPNYLSGIHEKEQYAKGWYDAFLLSYRKHKARFLERSQDLDDPEGSFMFIGEYEDPKLGRMIRFGILRFRGRRLHTLYYTAPKEGFGSSFDLFSRMERKHRYFVPRK